MIFKAVYFAFGALCLLSLFANQRQMRAWRVALPAFVICVLAYCVAADRLEERRKTFADTSTSRLVHGAIRDLRRALADPEVRDILLVDGGSYPARGLDGPLLNDLLDAGAGRRYAVVQLTQGGANHFERYETFRLLVRELDAPERSALASRNVSLWLEVQRGYDMMPMAQFNKSKFTPRTYGYLTASNAWTAAWTEWKYSNRKHRLNKLPTLMEILAHVPARHFNRGRLVPLDEIPVQSGYDPLPYLTKRFRGMAAVQARMSSAKRTRTAPWIDEVRTPRLERLMHGLIDRVEFYSVPTPYAEYGAYVRRFCRDHRQLCIDYTDPVLLASLNDASFWADSGHLSRRGALTYTRWLAARYLDAQRRSPDLP